MNTDIYTELMEVMQARGGAYSGLDIPEFFAMAKALFTPEEVRINNAMPKGFFTAEKLAGILEDDPEDVGNILNAMAKKGLCLSIEKEGRPIYLRSRFIPGILELQFARGTSTDHDKKMAELVHEYKEAYDLQIPLLKKTGPQTIRIIPVDRTIAPGNKVNTYDQVQSYIDSNEHIALNECFCRHAALLRGEDLHGMPTDTCMQFGIAAEYSIRHLGSRRLSKQEARQVLDRCEEAGLIHMSQNWTEGIGFICNCDRWYCDGIRAALADPKPGSLINSGFEPKFDHDTCIGCAVCAERCPAEAIEPDEDDLPEINLDRCIGCAVCATGCPVDAIAMVAKQDYPSPPATPKELKNLIQAAEAGN